MEGHHHLKEITINLDCIKSIYHDKDMKMVCDEVEFLSPDIIITDGEPSMERVANMLGIRLLKFTATAIRKGTVSYSPFGEIYPYHEPFDYSKVIKTPYSLGANKLVVSGGSVEDIVDAFEAGIKPCFICDKKLDEEQSKNCDMLKFTNTGRLSYKKGSVNALREFVHGDIEELEVKGPLLHEYVSSLI